MDSLFTFGNTREIRSKHIKHVSQQSFSNAPGSVSNILDNEKAILFSQYASEKYKNILKHVPYANEQNRKIQNNDHITAVYQLNISHVKI